MKRRAEQTKSSCTFVPPRRATEKACSSPITTSSANRTTTVLGSAKKFFATSSTKSSKVQYREANPRSDGDREARTLYTLTEKWLLVAQEVALQLQKHTGARVDEILDAAGVPRDILGWDEDSESFVPALEVLGQAPGFVNDARL